MNISVQTNMGFCGILLTCLIAPAWGAAPTPPGGSAWACNLPVYETSLDLATPHGTFREFGHTWFGGQDAEETDGL